MNERTEYDDFVLLKPHRHNGVLQQPGARLTLPVKLGNWLVSQNIAKRGSLLIATSLAAPTPTPVLLTKPRPKRAAKRCCGW